MTMDRRIISVTFELGKGSFGESGFNTITVSGLRTSCTINRGGGAAFSAMSLTIFGLSLSAMNELVTVGAPEYRTRKNYVTVSAGDANGLSKVFRGTIMTAWFDAKGMPDVALTITANSGQFEAMKPISGISVKGSANAGDLLGSVAAKMGYAYQQSGTMPIISNPHFDGTAATQIEQICEAANLDFIMDDVTLSVFPKGTSRTGQTIEVNKDTGMVGYPGFTQYGITITTLFNPNIVFMGSVNVTSDVTPANGVWTPYIMNHELESEMPNGKWFTNMECLHYGQLAP